MVPDFQLEIAMSDITPADIEMLTRELNLRETTPTTLSALVHEFHRDWFREFKAMRQGATIETEDGKKVPAPDSVEAWANRAGINPLAAAGLHQKLNRLFTPPYIVEKPAADTLGEIIQSLESGRHVILSFGKHESDLDYLLVTNMLTRQIRERWKQRPTISFRPQQERARPLIIRDSKKRTALNAEMAARQLFDHCA